MSKTFCIGIALFPMKDFIEFTMEVIWDIVFLWKLVTQKFNFLKRHRVIQIFYFSIGYLFFGHSQWCYSAFSLEFSPLLMHTLARSLLNASGVLHRFSTLAIWNTPCPALCELCGIFSSHFLGPCLNKLGIWSLYSAWFLPLQYNDLQIPSYLCLPQLWFLSFL